MQDDQPVKPANILNIVATNQGKKPLTMETPKAKLLTPKQAQEMMQDGHVLVDCRSSAQFGAGHIPGAYNVQLSSSEFEQRVGWVVKDDTPIILLVGEDAEAQEAIYRMAFIALDSHVAGYVADGMEAWMANGLPMRTVPQMDVHTLHHKLSVNGLQVVDVRESDEWDEGHIEGAHFMPYTSMAPQLQIPSQLGKLAVPLEQEVAVTCATGKRSSSAISMMIRHGYERVYNVTGGMVAWQDAGYKMLDGEGMVCNV